MASYTTKQDQIYFDAKVSRVKTALKNIESVQVHSIQKIIEKTSAQKINPKKDPKKSLQNSHLKELNVHLIQELTDITKLIDLT